MPAGQFFDVSNHAGQFPDSFQRFKRKKNKYIFEKFSKSKKLLFLLLFRKRQEIAPKGQKRQKTAPQDQKRQKTAPQGQGINLVELAGGRGLGSLSKTKIYFFYFLQFFPFAQNHQKHRKHLFQHGSIFQEGGGCMPFRASDPLCPLQQRFCLLQWNHSIW